jgi:2-dehydropantoate 2-reductase
MKIAVLGAGAMGSIYGGFLSQKNEVWFIDVWKEHVDKINAEGLRIEEGDHMFVFHPKAVDNAKSVGPVDLVIVFVKSIDTSAALAKNQELFDKKTMVLSLQNGWGNADDIIKYVAEDNLFLGTTTHGGNVLGPGHICHAGRAKTFVGVRTGSPERAKVIVAALIEAGFDAFVADNVIKMVWAKLFANIVANPITALLNVRNGYMVECEDTEALMDSIIREAVTVVNATGMDFNADVIIADVKKGAHITAENRSSMLQDVTKKRKTEIEKISGAIVAKGKEVGIPTPYNTTMLRLIKALEGTYLDRSKK